MREPNRASAGIQEYIEAIRTWSQIVTRTFETGKQKHQIDALDGVRAVACLGVISFHLNLWSYMGGIWSPPSDNVGAMTSSLALAGEMGIILFFILSGFLLFLPFAKAILFESSWPSPLRFYTRRVFRILPGYYVALVLMMLYLAPDYLRPEHWQQLWLFITMRMDFPLTYQQINAPFWTLAIEFQFYLLLPLIAWGMKWIVRKGTLHQRVLKLSLCLIGLFAWGVLTRYWGVMIANSPKEFLLPHTVADALLPYVYGSRGKFYDSFALGMLISTVYVSLRNAPSPSREQVKNTLRQLSPWLCVLGVIILVMTNIWHFYAIYVAGKSLHFLDPYQGFLLQGDKDIFMPVLFEVGYGLCLLAIVFGPRALQRPFEWAPLRWIGFISYSLYLWHDPFILYFLSSLLPKFQQLAWSPAAQYTVYVLWVAITAFPLSVLLYRWLEMPAMRVGEKVCHLFETRKKRGEAIAIAVHGTPEKILVGDGGVADERQ